MTNTNAAPERISHERAMESAQRFIRAFFNNEGKKPEIQIPCRPEQDDDCVLIEYIKQQMHPPVSQSDEDLATYISELARDMRNRPYEDFGLEVEKLFARRRAPVSATAEEITKTLIVEWENGFYKDSKEAARGIQSALDAHGVKCAQLALEAAASICEKGHNGVGISDWSSDKNQGYKLGCYDDMWAIRALDPKSIVKGV